MVRLHETQSRWVFSSGMARAEASAQGGGKFGGVKLFGVCLGPCSKYPECGCGSSC